MAGEPRDPSSPMKRMGAALMAAHIGTELPKLAAESKGDPDAVAAREYATKWAFGPEAGALSPAELHKYAAAFRSKFPGLGGRPTAAMSPTSCGTSRSRACAASPATTPSRR